MTRFRNALAALSVLAAATCATAAMAANRFASLGLENKTQANITFTYAWGTGERKTSMLAPGEKRTYWYKYPTANQNNSPKFNIRFDADATSGKFIEKYNLTKNACPDESWSCAKKYVFKYEGAARKFVELYAAK
jgi:hypothetical protein